MHMAEPLMWQPLRMPIAPIDRMSLRLAAIPSLLKVWADDMQDVLGVSSDRLIDRSLVAGCNI